MRWLPDEWKRARRWDHWASSLARRYVRSSARRDALRMELLHLLSASEVVRNRWFVQAKRFFPQLHLSIQPVLQSLNQTFLLKSSEPVSSPDARFVSRYEAQDWLTNHSAASIAYELRRAPEASFRQLNESAVERIFNRTGYREMTQRYERSLVGSIARELSDRLTQQTSRTESRLIQTPAANARPTTEQLPMLVVRQPEEKRPLKNEKSDQKTPSIFDGVPGAEILNRSDLQQQSINIDQITDQVIRQLDRKVIAARERRGRTF